MQSENKPRLRLDPSDEGMHPLEAASNFNESMYFNVFDPKQRLGGWFRLGNRANEGYAELTVCIYDTDGTVYFRYRRPKITNNDAFDAGGMRLSVVAPFEYTALVWGIAIDWVVWQALPGARMLTGAAIVIGAGLYLLHRERAPASG